MSTTKIHVEIAGQIISATLSDNSAATSLIKQLPLTLTFNDYNAVEKTGALPEALDLSRMPQGAEPQIGDIGYCTQPGARPLLRQGRLLAGHHPVGQIRGGSSGCRKAPERHCRDA